MFRDIRIWEYISNVSSWPSAGTCMCAYTLNMYVLCFQVLLEKYTHAAHRPA